MNDLDEILAKASAAIERTYFQLPRFGEDAVYRERVYCYELYHQLRLRWSNKKFFLTAEVDKRGHHALQDYGVKYENPDFLIHDPGQMDNHAIIEVKHAEAQDGGIEKDLRTLSLFKHGVGYTRAIYLIYGYEADEAFLSGIKQMANALDINGPIELWLHPDVGKLAEHVDNI